MFTLFGIVLLVVGAVLTFAIDRQADGLDLQLVGWILMAGGGLSLFVGMIRTAGVATTAPRHVPSRAIGDRTTGRSVERAAVHDPQHDPQHAEHGGPSDAVPNDVARPEQERRAA